MTTKEYADGLRLFAAWLDDHQDVELQAHDLTIGLVDTKENVERTIRALAPCRKEFNSETVLTLRRDFGMLPVKLLTWRSTVCTQRVVGTEVVPAAPAYTREVVEWDCGPILASDETVTTEATR